VFSAAAGQKKRPVKSKKKLPKLIVLFLIVGAVFNRDLLGLAYTYKMKFHTRFQDLAPQLLDTRNLKTVPLLPRRGHFYQAQSRKKHSSFFDAFLAEIILISVPSLRNV
jgi:hypothetical protein